MNEQAKKRRSKKWLRYELFWETMRRIDAVEGLESKRLKLLKRGRVDEAKAIEFGILLRDSYPPKTMNKKFTPVKSIFESVFKIISLAKLKYASGLNFP